MEREGFWRWKWQWRGELFEMERPILNNLIDMVNRCPLKQDKEVQWKWRFNTDEVYVTKAAYNHLMLDKENNEEYRKVFTIIWNK